MRIEYGSDAIEWKWWDGDLLSGSVERPIAFDTETELIDGPLSTPRLALAMAFDGKTLVLIHPSRVAEFIRCHKRQRLVGHNWKFDFWVLHQFLEGTPEQRIIWDQSNADRYSDTMILDMLLQLATGKYHKFGGGGASDDIKLVPSNLSVVAVDNGLPELDKTDEYRLRYAELIGLSQAEIEAHPEYVGFASYALKDVIATYRVYERQFARAVAIMNSVGQPPYAAPGGYQILPDALPRFGPLTEYVQVKASIVLDELSRHPLPIDQIERQRLEEAVRAQYQSCFDTLLGESPQLFKRFKAARYGGAMRMTKRSLVPQMDQNELKATLQRIADERGFPAPQADGKLKGISTSAKLWAKLAHQHSFIAAWCSLEKWAKQLEFLQTLNANEVYTRYSLLMRSGRTSAGAWMENRKKCLASLNLQQIPRDSEFRSLFVAPPGCVYACIDFSYVELRTLAATLAARFGKSRLQDVIVEHTKHGGLDPHEVLALSLYKLDEAAWRNLDKTIRKEYRQRAKICSFGFPGGLGTEKFIQYAAAVGVKFTVAEAKAAKETWFETYPEMRLYLGDRTRHALRYQLGNRIEPVLKRISDPGLRLLSDLLRGKELSTRAAEAAWRICDELVTAAKRWDLVEDVQEQRLSRELRQITTDYVTTLTGRVRANTGFCDGANSPFQGLAADGSKLALQKLRYAGYKLVLFVHDEILVELPHAGADRELKRIERLMNEAMEEVTPGVPCNVEGTISPCWAKP